MEIWKPIKNFDNLYEVSNLGRIRSIKNNIKMLYPKYSPTGYRTIQLYIKNKMFTEPMHRLVAEAFVPNPNNLVHIEHKNGRKLDNRANNLRWVSVTKTPKHVGKHEDRKAIKILCLEENKIFESGRNAARWILEQKICDSTKLATISANIRQSAKSGKIKYKYHWKII